VTTGTTAVTAVTGRGPAKELAMSHYLLIYRADPAAMASMPQPTPDQMGKMTTA
jgi:hypothetical protein